jgi:integrase
MPIQLLTPSKIERELKKPGRYADGAGLYLQIADGGTRAWLFQYSWQGRIRQLGLGSYVHISLAAARKKAKAARDMVGDGIDPIALKREKRKASAVKELPPTSFEAFATEYIAIHSPSWRNETHRKQWTSTLKSYAFPVIGKMNVADIDTPEILRVLKPIWRTKPETASRVRQRIEKILGAAKATKLRSGDNPAQWDNHLEHSLPKLSAIRKVRHMPAMPYAALPSFVGTLAERDGIAARALEMLILTATRTGSLIGMKDRELDLQNGCTWTIPGTRMKTGKEHIVPLCDRALDLLRNIPREKDNPYLFMGQRRGSHISNMTMLELMRKIAPDYVPHGFRSSYTDWANECTSASHETIEKSLAHTIKSKTEAAYRRGDLLEKRRALMIEWQDFLYNGKP